MLVVDSEQGVSSAIDLVVAHLALAEISYVLRGACCTACTYLLDVY